MSRRIEIAKKVGIALAVLIIPGALGLYAIRYIVKIIRDKE